MVIPFLSLFLSTDVHAGPVQVTVFLIVAPLASVIVSTLLARLSDRREIRRMLLIAASIAGVISTALTTFVRDYRVLLALTVTATALATTLFPQSFAYARQVLAATSRAGPRWASAPCGPSSHSPGVTVRPDSGCSNVMVTLRAPLGGSG
jgi:SET family sugar efflux transporter-like MFS transporter